MFQQRERHLFGYTASKTHNKGNTKRSKNMRVDIGTFKIATIVFTQRLTKLEIDNSFLLSKHL